MPLDVEMTRYLQSINQSINQPINDVFQDWHKAKINTLTGSSGIQTAKNKVRVGMNSANAKSCRDLIQT